MKPGYAFVFLLRVRLIAYVYPLLPGIYTLNRDIIGWYITELKKAFNDSKNERDLVSLLLHHKDHQYRLHLNLADLG
jgi:hypothetical protein